jgi:hypothetical protein
MPLSDQEEAIVSLMQKINKLEHENRELKEELRMLKWSIMEHD